MVIPVGLDGKFYGIPFTASRVVRFHPNDTTLMEQIGPDLGVVGAKWSDGIMADGVIYCVPFNSDKVLKIDTNVENNGNVTTIDIDLPEEGNAKWCSGATSKIDGCIYCMPESANRILKIKTTEDSFESVGVDLGNRIRKFRGAVADEDGFIYGIPYLSKQIVKVDPSNPESPTNVGKEADEDFECGDGVLGNDGNIYCCNAKGDILVIDVANKGSYSWIRNTLQSTHADQVWGKPIVGMDGCIYWPPRNANRVMRLNIITQVPELIGDDLGDGRSKWNGGALGSNGIIYCIPLTADYVLAIDTRPAKSIKAIKEDIDENVNSWFHAFAEANKSIPVEDCTIRRLQDGLAMTIVSDPAGTISLSTPDIDLQMVVKSVTIRDKGGQLVSRPKLNKSFRLSPVKRDVLLFSRLGDDPALQLPQSFDVVNDIAIGEKYSFSTFLDDGGTLTIEALPVTKAGKAGMEGCYHDVSAGDFKFNVILQWPDDDKAEKGYTVDVSMEFKTDKKIVQREEDGHYSGGVEYQPLHT